MVPVTAPSSLPRHLALALNVRGIAVYDPENPPDREFFTWLARKHQYRNVGIPPTLMDHPAVGIADYKTFEPTPFPMAGLDSLSGRTDIGEPWAVESLLAASAYVSPLFVHRPALDAFKPFAIWRLESAPELSEDQVLRHVRIAGYGMLDAYEEMVDSGYEAVLDGTVEAERERRADWATEDGQERFWRLREEVSGDTLVGGYYDALPAFVDDQAKTALDTDPNLLVGLGLVGGLAVDPPYG